ncbi:MAG: response regulator [Blastochloris sp.]|nr:response regulator [Blastochloris sp.]
MNARDEHENQPRMRVIVIDNDIAARERWIQTLQLWNYHVFSTEGVGSRLIEHAKEYARRYRCHLALVDLRLIDDQDLHDRSGLELIPDLTPTVAILFSSYMERRTVRQALRDYGAFDVFAKEDSLDELREMLRRVADDIALGAQRPGILWPHGLSSATIRDFLFTGQPDIPEDEIDDVLCRVSPKHTRCA